MITNKEYKSRRNKLASELPKDSIAFIFAGSEKLRNGDAHYKFRQASNFYYLTGFNEPQAILVIEANKSATLFNRPRNEQEEIWNGAILGQEQAVDTLGIEHAVSIHELDSYLEKLVANKSSIYYLFDQEESFKKHVFPIIQKINSQTRRGTRPCESMHDLSPILSEMRVIKSKAEIALMKKANAISIKAHLRALKNLKSLKNESELEAEILYELNRLGCTEVAYTSIVAGGNNACTLHYIENNQPLKSEDLVLIDAGGEYHNYAADITRTFPVSGQYSPEQTQIYELVLKAQQAGIDLIKPGCPWNKIQEVIIKILTTGLLELGILKGEVKQLITDKAYLPFYMHGSGHWLGLDVHDCGSYKINDKWRKLEPGMLLTVEPGIYIRNNTKNVAKRWHGIGVRIEDDILVTASGHENLTEKLPKSINDIEAYMRD